MSVEIKMPALSPTMEVGTLARWLVKEGQRIAAGDILAEIETDKATMEFEAPEEGVLARILIAEGTDDVAVGTIIALLDNDAAASEIAASPAPMPAAPEETEPASPAEPPATTEPGPDHDAARDASPLASAIARATGVELGSVRGTGASGRVIKTDLLPPAPAIREVAAASPEIIAPQARQQPVDTPHSTARLSGMRRTIARRLTESKQQIPHIYLSVDMRAGALIDLRKAVNEQLAARGTKVSVNDMLIKALALALLEVPACNVMFDSDQMIHFERADIAVAVSVPGGLVTPVIRDAGGKTLSSIAAEMGGLAARARAGTLSAQDYAGGTASLSNLGMFGVDRFDAVINPPQAMIMAFGATFERAVVDDNIVHPAAMMTATGSFDHRAIDGADAARLMQALRTLIESPTLLLT